MSRYRIQRKVCTAAIVLGWGMSLAIALVMLLALLRILPPALAIVSGLQLTPFLCLGLLLAMFAHVANAVFDIADHLTRPQ